MALPTIYQRIHLWLWHWKTGGVDPSYLATLYEAGARVICVQLQDDGSLPREKVREWKGLVEGSPLFGKHFSVWGVVRPSGEPLYAPGSPWTPETVATWAAAEKARLGLNGLRFNLEDEVELQDMTSGGLWSSDFVEDWRKLCPRCPSILDTYKGAAGMNLDAYRAAGFRLAIQTYDATGLWTDPVRDLVRWTGERGWPRSYVRPVFQVAPFAGERLPSERAILSARAAGTKGISLYYVDGAFDVLSEYLVPFCKEAISAGIAR